jgi:hypothetical protein
VNALRIPERRRFKLQRIHDGKVELTGQEPRDPRDVEFRIVCSNERKLFAALLIGHYALFSSSSAGHSQKMLSSWQKPVSRLPLYRNAPTGGGAPQVPMESNSRSSIIRQTQLFSKKNGIKPRERARSESFVHRHALRSAALSWPICPMP